LGDLSECIFSNIKRFYSFGYFRCDTSATQKEWLEGMQLKVNLTGEEAFDSPCW